MISRQELFISRIKNNLHNPASVTQINKNKFPVIPPCRHPAEKFHFFADEILSFIDLSSLHMLYVIMKNLKNKPDKMSGAKSYLITKKVTR